MELNRGKYSIRFNAMGEEACVQLEFFFPFYSSDIEEGIKYLGFMLKPNSYGYADWSWLVLKIQARIDMWVNWFLSHGGQLVLRKSILCSILMYWATITKIPKGIMIKIHKAYFWFLWLGKNRMMESLLLNGHI
jgi:hypothetical protein